MEVHYHSNEPATGSGIGDVVPAAPPIVKIGQQLNLTRERIRHIEAGALRQLHRLMQTRPMGSTLP
jgi:hypothetical protein